ncbi:hypothetical protein NPIL_9001 [Nephila pilipes]|uniref:Uncharacterized protein n=1 Tax=Nephila pilipes TaxID=299642 RepID=A0A8X6NER3_NEPPI|nr:hypothetical protein NPIL_9001 [Nephila pilipes]
MRRVINRISCQRSARSCNKNVMGHKRRMKVRKIPEDVTLVNTCFTDVFLQTLPVNIDVNDEKTMRSLTDIG